MKRIKFNVNYFVLLEGIKKFKEGKKLCEEEKQAVDKLFDATCGDYFPSEEELKTQENNMRILKTIDFVEEPLLWNQAMRECNNFENKYC